MSSVAVLVFLGVASPGRRPAPAPRTTDLLDRLARASYVCLGADNEPTRLPHDLSDPAEKMSKESKHVTAFCDRHLKPGEKMVCHVEGYTGDVMGSGSKTQHNGALVVTDQRVAFYRKGFIGDVFQSIPLAKLTSVEQRSTMGLKTVIMHTSHDELSFKTFDKDGFESAVAAVEQGRDYAAVSPAPGTPSSADDPIESLKRLKDLHVAGILSDAEYEAKKKELLSRM